MKPLNSFAEYPAATVEKACQSWLDWRKSSIKKKRDALVQKARNRLFRKPMSFEQAEKRLVAGGIWNDYGGLVLWAGVEAHHVENLLALAQTTLGPVYVSSTDAGIIFNELLAAKEQQ